MKKLLAKIRKILKDRRTRQLLTRIVSVTAAIVVFVTTYALVLPAITMETEAQCGIPAHQHDDSCYEEILTCEIPESEGHHHTEDCYTTKQELDCKVEEHQHGTDCYDADGNLVCGLTEHTHSVDNGCYEEARELTCEIPESDGHQHDSSCYEKVLTCGKEVHTHSAECYSDSTTADTEYAAVEISSGGGTSAAAASTGNAEAGVDNAASGTGTAESAGKALTIVDNAEAGITEDGHYVPELAPINFSTVLDNHTGIYYHAVEDGEVIEDSTALTYDKWNRVKDNTELGTADLLRVYLAYTIPAGALNPTNPVARYRLPGNLHLSDAQVKAISETVNGIASQYVNMDTLEILDTEKYYAYLGIEAVEGTRTPIDDPDKYLADISRKTGTTASEYISATIRAENVYDEQSGELTAQDLVFTWTPYTIEKNQHEYDSTGNPTKAGEEISGWLSLDFNLSQVDFPDPDITTFERKIENETETDQAVENHSEEEQSAGAVENTAAVETVEHREQTADIIFVEEGRDENNQKIHEISTTLTVVEEIVLDTHVTDDQTPEDTIRDGETVDGTEESDEPSTGETADAADADEAIVSAEDDNKESADPEANQVIMPAMSFNDSITVRTGKPADVEENAGGTVANAADALPEKAEVTVRVEADEGTFPAGTTMKLKAVDNLDDVAKAVAETVENPTDTSSDSTDSTESTDAADSVESTESSDAVDMEKSDPENKQSAEEAQQDQNEKPEEEKDKSTVEGAKNLKTYGVQAVDITFVDAEGNEVEPAKPVRVALTSAAVEQVKERAKNSAVTDPVVIHVDDEGNAEQMELVAPEEIEPAQGKTEEELLEETYRETDKQGEAETAADTRGQNVDDTAEDNMEFQTDSFSVYAIVYTVELYTKIITDSGETYRITVTYDETSGIPQDAELKVKEIKEDDEGYDNYFTEAVRAAAESSDVQEDVSSAASGTKADDGKSAADSAAAKGHSRNKNAYARFFDIEIWSDGQKIEPSGDVSVSIRLLDVPENDDKHIVKIIHFADDGTEVMPHTEDRDDEGNKDTAENQREDQAAVDSNKGVMEFDFTANTFSVYSVVSYTVDFEYSVNGKMYQFSLPGGGFVSFTDLIEVLGIIGDKNSEDNNAIIDAATQNVDGTIDVTVSDAAKKFVADVTSVEFSSSELVDVSKVKEDTTVGQIKENRGLKCEYSAELTEEQIEAINAQTVKAGDWALISMQPFISEETLTVTMKDGEVFTIRMTDAQIRKTVIDAKGDTWEITVTYGDDAQIPDNAELKVEEILPEDGKYEDYYQKSLETAGVINANPEGEYAHVFNIQIWSDDHEVEPASAVAVNIKLLDTPEEEDIDLKVVHFSKDGPEMMDTGNGEEMEAGKAELSFMTEEFSVYTVVNVNNSTDIVGDGPWVLVSGIAGDPGATTGYSESWGRDYFTIIVNANAMSDEAVTYQGNNVAFAAEGVHVWTNGSQSYVGGDVPQVWYFERVPNNNNRYYIYVLRNGQKYYIDHHNNGNFNSATTSLSTQWKTEFTVERNSDGTISLRNANNNSWYLCNNGNGEFSGRDFRFQQNVGTQSRAKFRLCKQSDDFESFAAKKVSVQELTGNDRFLIYRKFMDEAGNEQLYALASDGTFVRVYDGGDSVYWRETDKNIYWNYLKDGTYYGIFSTDPQTGEKKYLNPMASTGVTITTDPSRLTLIGKDTGEYSTAIENWDQVSYDYAGLHVTLDGQGVPSLGTGTRVAGTSDEFLFAVDSSMPGSTPVPVATVDSDSLGIKITMFDYGDAKHEYAAGDKLSGMTTTVGTGSDAYTPHEAHALVKPYLVSGLPSGNSGAMTGLFTTGGSQVTAYRENVNHLFLQSYYDENGMFRYRSEDNYAYLPFNPDGSNSGNRITSNDFIVYQQAATPYTTDTKPGHTYYYHGHFMPFNDIDTTQHVGRLMNQYGNDYDTGSHTVYGELPIGDGRTYEEIYGTTGIPNFYTGMKMEARFSQPKNGKLDNGDDMIFKFTGDDDMWVYIDDVLILDVGGIHEPLSGTINFATGKVTNPAGSSLAGETTLYQIFQNVLTASSTPQSVKNKINAISWVDVNGDGTPDTFADYGNHTFSSFYMERGAGASNLDIQFNLNVVLTNQFTVTKELPEKIDDRFANQKFRFRATYEQNGQEVPLHAGIDGVCISVVYKNRVQLDKNGNPVLDVNGKTIPVPVPVDQNGYFELMAGETAVFMMANEEIKYNVREVGIDQYNLEEVTIEGGGTTRHVEINSEQAVIDENAAAAGMAAVTDRSSVLYTNYPKTQDLLITKHILGDKVPVNGKEPVFEFRVYLEMTEGDTRHLVPYSYGPYYLVKIPEGQENNKAAWTYYTLTGTGNTPVEAAPGTVCSTTGRSGSINSIPEGYTIVIPDLTIGTSFYLEERRDNIPEGYRYIREELTPDTYDPSSLIAAGEDINSEAVIDRIIARDEDDHQKFDPNTVGQIKDGANAESHVYNASRTTVSVHKIWDSQPVSGTSVTVELHRYAPLVKGTVGVTLLDQRDVPVKGADFQLQKQDGENWVNVGGTIQTNQNGEASVSNLDAGTYKLVQVSTPEGYTMPAGSETTPVTVQGSTTDKEAQTHMETLHNQALFTAATVQLTLTDAYQKTSDHQDIPISGALFDLYKVGESEPIATGLKTTDGLVAYGPLSAGNYYLVQTFTPAGYILPNDSHIDFQVQELPGQDQTVQVTAANEAIATATVYITLTRKGNADPISGADFAVYRADGTTASSVGTCRTGGDGKASISINGYYGTFVLKQTSTASGLAVAEDREFSVARGLTGQEINLTVENEEAAGNNTVVVYTGQSESKDGSWNSGDIEFGLTKRGLNAGEEVSYQVNIGYQYGERAWYCLDFNPSTHTGTWQEIPTGSHTFTFKVPNGASDMTYNLAVKSNWGLNGQGKVTLVESSANSAAAPQMLSMAQAMAAPSLTSAPAATAVNAAPPAAPEGYAEDSGFTPITITLDGTVDDTETAAWFAAFASQEAVDDDGNLYYYYVVEKEPVPTGYRIESYSYDKGEPLAGSGTVTITNAKVQSGPLQITKAVTVDGIPVTDANKTFADGPYTFKVEKLNADGTAVDTSFAAKTVTITVTNGEAASDILHDLPFGKYRVTENAVNNGTTVTGITGGTANVANRTTTIEVTDSSTEENPAAVTFTNNTETVTAKIVKVWNHTGNTGTRPTSLTVTLSNGDSRELNENNNWTAEVTDLPKYDRTTGNPIEYSWTEAELPAGYYLSNIQESNDTATGVITTTITNSFTDRYNPTTTITGKKVWDDGGEGRPDSITVNLYKDGGSTPDRTITVQAPTSEGADQNQWPFEFTNLPVFNIDGSVIQYTVEEVLPEGYTDEYGIKIEFSQATYIAGDTTGEIVNSGEGSQTFKISDGFNLGYIVIRHGNDFIIWTPRPATADEISAIKTKVVTLSDQFNGIGSASGDSMKIVSGVPDTVDVGNKHAVSVYMQNGEVWMKFLNPNAWSDFAYGTIPYTYTQAGGEGGGSITNTKKNTDIEFGKQWIDIGQQEIEWDQDIQVTVSRNKADGNKDSTFSLVYTVAKSEVNSAVGGTVEFSTGTEADPKLKLTITTEEGKKKYKFKIENLAYSGETDGKYTYYVEETNSQLAGYLAPSYWNIGAPTGGTAAYDDGIIINKQEGGYELPSTGGPGTRLFTILGSILIAGAGLLLWRRRRLI